MLMLTARRRFCAAARFDLFAKSRDAVEATSPPQSDLKRQPSARVRKLVSEIMDLTLIEAADLCDLCQETLAPRSGAAYPSAMFASQMHPGFMQMPQMQPAPQSPQPATQTTHATQAAPVEAAPAAPAAPAEKVKPTIVSIKLVAFDAAKKVQTVKEVRAITNLGLKEAKDAVEAAPKILKKGVAYEEALSLKAKLEEIGATVELE